jgi:hypothetical protein
VFCRHRRAINCLRTPQEADYDDQPKKKIIEASYHNYDMTLSLTFSTVFETQSTVRRQATKDKKLEKQKKRALKVTYQENPDDFEKEPSELHSDADRDEDTMVCSFVLFPAT